ncbi:hypothetical protein HLBENOHH_02469 [Aeromonas dhakensis]|uniref:phage major capsid protein n=1 Tax=Aeromonas dhakensis TaxID=196024 RepID=UPI00366FD0F4
MEQLEQLLAAQAEQAQVITGLKSELAEMKVKGVDPEAEKKELKRKFFEIAKKGDGQKATDLIEEGKVKAAQMGEKGDTIIPDINREIITRVLEGSALTAYFGRDVAANTDYTRKVAVGEGGTYWEGDTAAESAPELKDIKATSGKVISLPTVKNDVAADSFFDIEAFILNEVSRRIGAKVSGAVLNGDGVNKPLGLLKHFDKTEGVKAIDARKIDMFGVVVKADGEELIDSLRRQSLELPSAYQSSARWAMSLAAYERLCREKDTTGHSFIQKDVTQKSAGTLHGYEIIVDRMLPADAPVMFGDFEQAFAVVELPNTMQFLRNEYVKPFHVQWNIGFRVGTIVKSNEAITGFYLA